MIVLYSENSRFEATDEAIFCRKSRSAGALSFLVCNKQVFDRRVSSPRMRGSKRLVEG